MEFKKAMEFKKRMVFEVMPKGLRFSTSKYLDDWRIRPLTKDGFEFDKDRIYCMTSFFFEILETNKSIRFHEPGCIVKCWRPNTIQPFISYFNFPCMDFFTREGIYVLQESTQPAPAPQPAPKQERYISIISGQYV